MVVRQKTDTNPAGPPRWLSADAQPTSAEVTLAQLRMPELTIADIEQAEADSLKYRYE